MHTVTLTFDTESETLWASETASGDENSGEETLCSFQGQVTNGDAASVCPPSATPPRAFLTPPSSQPPLWGP